MSSFSFVSDVTLRTNLDVALDHINELVAVSESKEYSDKPVQVSSFRKTIIIHIAAIIEALLSWKLEQVADTEKVELVGEWKYLDIKVLHTIDDSGEVIAGKRKKATSKTEKINFLQLTNLCEKHQIIKSSQLKADIDKVRVHRNKQHLGGLPKVEKKYSKQQLEFCFNVAERVKKTVSK